MGIDRSVGQFGIYQRSNGGMGQHSRMGQHCGLGQLSRDCADGGMGQHGSSWGSSTIGASSVVTASSVGVKGEK